MQGKGKERDSVSIYVQVNQCSSKKTD